MHLKDKPRDEPRGMTEKHKSGRIIFFKSSLVYPPSLTITDTLLLRPQTPQFYEIIKFGPLENLHQTSIQPHGSDFTVVEDTGFFQQ